MQLTSHTLVWSVACALISVALSASPRTQSPPGISSGPARSQTLDVANKPFSDIGSDISTISCQKLTSDPPGVVTACFTMSRLSQAYGGNGRRSGVVMGALDLRTRTFAPSHEADALNDPSYHHYNLHVEPRLGRYAVVERRSATTSQPLGVLFAARAAAATSFATPVVVQNIQGTIDDGYDASIGWLGGRLQLFYQATLGGQQGIYRDALDLSNLAAPRAAGSPVLVIKNLASWTKVHSPAPVAGPDGDVEGLWFARRIAQDSDMLFANDLDPETPAELTLDDAGWMNNGAVAGGLLLCAANAHAYRAALIAEAAWLLGDAEDIGATADLVAGAWSRSTSSTTATIVFLSTGIAPWPSFPGYFGRLGIQASPLIVVGAMVHDADQLASARVPIPRLASLKGKALALQGLTLELPSNVFTFTNTAWIHVR